MRVVIITGASDGIGAEIARQPASREGLKLLVPGLIENMATAAVTDNARPR